MGTARLGIAAAMLLVVACASPDQQASAPEARASDERDASSPESADASPGSGDQPSLPVPDGTGNEYDGAAASTQAAHLDVEGRRLDGGRLDLGELIGSPVALWMWTPW